MIEVEHLTKRYGEKYALNDISFTVEDGEILGFLGPNGAGKTTTMNIITGYLSSTRGTVTVDGHEIFAEPRKVKSRIGYLPEQPPLYPDMSVDEYLGFVHRLKRVGGDRREHIARVRELVKIGDVGGRIIKNLSKGYRQRVGLAQALLGDPKVLILDEPTAGLDPKQIIDIRKLIRELGKKHTIILSSHILSEVQATCGRIIVIAGGRLIADGTPDKLSRSLGAARRLSLCVQGPEQEVLALLRSLPGIRAAEPLGAREERSFEYEIEAQPDKDVRAELFRRLADKNWPILQLRGSEGSLEEIFLQLTGEEAEAPPAPRPKKRSQKHRERKGEKS